jgi:hypothetical protein
LIAEMPVLLHVNHGHVIENESLRAARGCSRLRISGL